jgi:hypothetical protein
MRLAALFVLAALADAPQGGAPTDLDGRRVDPLHQTPGLCATTLIFMRTDCPLAGQVAPEIERVRKTAEGRGVRVWLVYLDRTEPAERVRAHLAEFGLKAQALRDPDHALAALAGVHVTPEAALFVHEAGGPRLVYRGRIDDRVVTLGRKRPHATKFDLREAIEDALAGRATSLQITPAFGCEIADLR